MWHGILIINKERGLTSHQVVANLRRILRQKEIGHTGTLDPEATGVLVMGLGQATRSFPFLKEDIKVYQAEIILGRITDTQDDTGKVLQENPDFHISLTRLQQATMSLTGPILQTPPMYSAVKIHGQKLYDLARKGLEVDRTPRQINVFGWKILNPGTGYGFGEPISCEISCSKGTYIRTLINDLGLELGTGACMGRLIRLRSGDFSLADSVTTAQVKENLDQGILGQIITPLDVALHHLIPLKLGEEDLEKVIHGGKISYDKYFKETPPGTLARVLNQSSEVIAVARLEDAGTHLYWQPVKVFRQ